MFAFDTDENSMVSMAVPTNRTSRRQVILFTMSLGVFIAQLDSQVVNLAIKAIGSDLNAGINALQWVLDSYNLFYATLLLTGGTLGDLSGRTRVFAIGIGLIVLGSIVCAAAPNDTILIAGRAITGVGAALEVPTSLAILTVAYADDKERARAIGIWASCNGLALAAGPTIGGLLVDAAGWRSIFILVVPVSALAMVLAMRRVPESSDPQGRHVDPAGQALAIAALGTLSFVTIEGPHWGFASPIILTLAVACVVSAVLFVASQHGRPGALVPLDFFRNRGFNAALAVAGMMTFGMYAMLFLTPLYLQSLGGISAFMVGLALLPLSVTFVIVSQYSGALVKRFGARAMMTAGMAAMGGGLLLLTGVSATPNMVLIETALLIIGAGLGLNTGPVNTVAVASVPLARSGTASGLVNTSRMVGATLGVAVLGSLFAVHAGDSRPEATVSGLRLAYLGGAVVELTGALIALAFIRDDAIEQKAS
jgi:DHA2 family methylenomycin A resistance protein-like MFS transporter